MSAEIGTSRQLVIPQVELRSACSGLNTLCSTPQEVLDDSSLYCNVHMYPNVNIT